MGETYDVVIGGGGIVGATLALALSKALGGEARIAVIAHAGQQRGFGSGRDDVRASAIAGASQALLDALGVWPAVAPQAQQVRRIDITESPLHAGVRPVLLSYEPVLTDGRPAMYIAPNVELTASVAHATADAPGVARVTGEIASLKDADDAGRTVLLSDGRAITGRLIAACDGRGSRLRDAASIRTVSWPCRQTAIVTRISFDQPHDGVAVQHFLPAGPFAILPLTGSRACITWSEETAVATALGQADDATFLGELQLRIGARYGTARLDGGRDLWPLDMHLARDFTAPRLALVGDSAHGVHPIAGQGLNLSLRDVAALAECLADGMRVGLDPGSPHILDRYQRWRRFDTMLSAASFDLLNRMFSQDWPIARSAREVGLGLVDRAPALKRLLVAEAAGATGTIPKLLTGVLP